MVKDFTEIGCKIMEILREEKKMKDVVLMMKLGFNPENWRLWRAKYVELFEGLENRKIDQDGKEKFVYDKKQKLWYVKDLN